MITWAVGMDEKGSLYTVFDDETHPYKRYGTYRSVVDAGERAIELRDRQARGEDISAEEDRCNQTIAQ